MFLVSPKDVPIAASKRLHRVQLIEVTLAQNPRTISSPVDRRRSKLPARLTTHNDAAVSHMSSASGNVDHFLEHSENQR